MDLAVGMRLKLQQWQRIPSTAACGHTMAYDGIRNGDIATDTYLQDESNQAQLSYNR